MTGVSCPPNVNSVGLFEARSTALPEVAYPGLLERHSLGLPQPDSPGLPDACSADPSINRPFQAFTPRSRVSTKIARASAVREDLAICPQRPPAGNRRRSCHLQELGRSQDPAATQRLWPLLLAELSKPRHGSSSLDETHLRGSRCDRRASSMSTPASTSRSSPSLPPPRSSPAPPQPFALPSSPEQPQSPGVRPLRRPDVPSKPGRSASLATQSSSKARPSGLPVYPT